jgi:hypothetical protein
VKAALSLAGLVQMMIVATAERMNAPLAAVARPTNLNVPHAAIKGLSHGSQETLLIFSNVRFLLLLQTMAEFGAADRSIGHAR